MQAALAFAGTVRLSPAKVYRVQPVSNECHCTNDSKDEFVSPIFQFKL